MWSTTIAILGRVVTLTFLALWLSSLPLAKPSQAESVPAAETRTIQFSGYEWTVKRSLNTRIGPGPNYWSDAPKSVWVDENGGLHLKIRRINGKWHCAEVYLPTSLGFGKYSFEVIGRVDRLDQNAVGAVFAYLNDQAEIDIEFARWGIEDHENTQYVVQPGYLSGHLHKFDMQLNGAASTHQFIWKPAHVLFRSIHGHYRVPPNPQFEVREWAFTQANDVPTGDLRPHINAWLNNGQPPSDGEEVELVIQSFEFSSYDAGNNLPTRPYSTTPADGSTDISLTPTLTSSVFSDPNLDGHRASQWQIRSGASENGINLVWDSGTDSTNLESVTIPSNVLDRNTAYHWRVRHQDSTGAWSQWSEEASFVTKGTH